MSTLGRYEGPTADELLAAWIEANPDCAAAVTAAMCGAESLDADSFKGLREALFRAMERDHA